MTITYEEALGFIIRIRPRLAVADADRYARELLDLTAGAETLPLTHADIRNYLKATTR